MPDEGSYIRGAGANSVDPRRVAWVLAVGAVVVLAGSTVVLFLFAASGDSSNARLRSRGVPVQATVTGCTGISSGIGMSVEYYTCKGSYTLDGASFEVDIRGSRAQMPPGRVVQAVAVPGDPASLSLPSYVRASDGSSYVAPAVLAALTVLGAAGLLVAGVGARRRRRRSAGVPHPQSVKRNPP